MTTEQRFDGIRFVTTLAGIRSSALDSGFFQGWPSPLTSEEHHEVLERSDHVVLAIDGDSVVGFANALSDGVLSVYIPLLEVVPGHRGRGIGSELIRRLLVEVGPLYMIDVMCDADAIPFYERLGFTASTGGIMRNRR